MSLVNKGMRGNLVSLAIAATVTLSTSHTIAGTSSNIKAVSPDQIVKMDRSAVSAGDTTKSVYLVRLQDPSLASYNGGLSGLEATSTEKTGARKLDVNSARSQSYRSYLQSRHAELKSSIASAIGRAPNLVFEYFHASNGMALKLTAAEAAKVQSLPGVVSVQADFIRRLHTDAGPNWIGAPGVWNGTATGGLGATRGEGIIVGVLDTGINFSNPSFSQSAPDGYNHINPLGQFVGVCDNTDPVYDPAFVCNNKLIGAWDFTGSGPIDDNGHGSHTAGTAAGNTATIVAVAPTTSQFVAITGVAPRANIIAYDVCDTGGCPGSAIVAGIDQAIADGVDVINFSIGSPAPSDPWHDADTLAFLNARSAGIFVATSAGNEGAAANTVGSPADAPWVTAVGATSHDRVIENTLAGMTGGDSAPPADMTGKGNTAGLAQTSIVHAADSSDALCLNPFPAGTWTNNEIVVCDRGTNARITKGENVMAGGAAGYVLANTPAYGEETVVDLHLLPAVHIGATAGDALRSWLASGSGHMAQITGADWVYDPAEADKVAGFSSRGANRAVPGVVKPDIAAPGVNILAAHGVNNPPLAVWTFLSGTSMASPHVAGAAALVSALQPGWTPAEIESALMSTAFNGMAETPFAVGAGRVDLGSVAQAGIVLDESTSNFLAAEPLTGGNPSSLNLASFGNQVCPGSCSWTRTVTSSAAVPVAWTASVTDPADWELSVSPASFTLPAGGTQEITVTAKLTSLAQSESWSFGNVMLQRGTGPGATFPVALALVPPPVANGSYTMTTSLTNPATCDTGYGGYVDLSGFGIEPFDPGSSTDTVLFSAFGTQNPVEFYGVPNTGFGFTDDGFLVFNASGYGGTPGEPQFLPNHILSNNLAAPLWADHEIVYSVPGANPDNWAGISLATDGPNVSIVEYDNIEPRGGGLPVGDFEVIVHSQVDNTPGVPEIMFAYDNLATLPAITTVGVEDPAGTEATALINKEAPVGLVNDLVVCFDYVADPNPCEDYNVITNTTFTGTETHVARKAILVGDNAVADAGTTLLSFETNVGGSVEFYPGFSIQTGAVVRVNTAASVCPL